MMRIWPFTFDGSDALSKIMLPFLRAGAVKRDVERIIVQSLRVQAGAWLRDLRTRRGMSQRQIAEAVGAPSTSFISRVEKGRSRLTPKQYRKWARALRVSQRTLVKTLMQHYDPITYEILFRNNP